MKEIDRLKQTIKEFTETTQSRRNKLQEAVEKIRAKRQEQTGKPYRQQ